MGTNEGLYNFLKRRTLGVGRNGVEETGRDGKVEVMYISISYFHTRFHMLRRNLHKRIKSSVDLIEPQKETKFRLEILECSNREGGLNKCGESISRMKSFQSSNWKRF